tara:strand:- start:23850 stop:24641 length:792 start_codon:yes stop_codon:yes gene_type:complete
MLAIIAASTNSFAQYSKLENVPGRFWRDFNIYPKTSIPADGQELIKANYVKKREKTAYYKGIPSTAVKHIDTDGKIIRIEYSKKEYKSTAMLKYTDFGKIKEVEKKNSKGQISKTTYECHSKNRLIKSESADFKKDYSKSEVACNEFDKLSYRKHLDKNTDTPDKELRYSYHENGDKKETNYYVKGKLKHTWLFECKPEGELINVKDKGTKTLHYKKKGKVNYTNLYHVGEHGKPLKTQSTGNRWGSKSIYTYNENDLIVSKI